MAASVEELCLIDVEDNKDYKIFVSCEDAEKARKGKNAITNLDFSINMNTIFTSFTNMNFATLLLQKAKKHKYDSLALQATDKRKYHKYRYKK